MVRAALLLMVLAFLASVSLWLPPHYLSIAKAQVSDLLVEPSLPDRPEIPADPWAAALVGAAADQIGVTTIYDGAYQSLAYPGGDIDRRRGVCTDVVIRALRDAHGIDLQQQVHEDMKHAFSSDPQGWGLSRPDRNIDHRRVPNLRRFFARTGAELPTLAENSGFKPGRFQPGDIVTWNLGPGLLHIGILADRLTADGHPLVIHNVGAGVRMEDFLFLYPITGHYRLQNAL